MFVLFSARASFLPLSAGTISCCLSIKHIDEPWTFEWRHKRIMSPQHKLRTKDAVANCVCMWLILILPTSAQVVLMKELWLPFSGHPIFSFSLSPLHILCLIRLTDTHDYISPISRDPLQILVYRKLNKYFVPINATQDKGSHIVMCSPSFEHSWFKTTSEKCSGESHNRVVLEEATLSVFLFVCLFDRLP